MVVVWSDSAKAELRKAYEYIALDSLEHAKMVKDTLIDLTIALSKHPEKHAPDKFKKKKIMMARGALLRCIIIVFRIA